MQPKLYVGNFFGLHLHIILYIKKEREWERQTEIEKKRKCKATFNTHMDVRVLCTPQSLIENQMN